MDFQHANVKRALIRDYIPSVCVAFTQALHAFNILSNINLHLSAGKKLCDSRNPPEGKNVKRLYGVSHREALT